MKYLSNRSPRRIWYLTVLFGLGAPMHIANAQAPEAPPETPKIPILNEYHGQKVIDDYEWLENAEEPKVRAWTEAQTKRTRSYLESLPEYNRFLEEFQKDIVGKTVRYSDIKFAGGKIFASKFEPPKPQPVIICRTSLSKEGEEQTAFDPAALDGKGLTSYDWFEPSPDGSMIALSLSHGGSESGDLRFIRVADAKLLDEAIEHVQFGTAGGSVAWAADGKGVFYTRYPRNGEREIADLNFYQQVYYHELGSPASIDRYEIGKGFPRIAEILLDRSQGGPWILATVSNGDGGEYEHFVRNADGKWSQVTKFEDRVKKVVFGGRDRLFLLSVKGAVRGQVLCVDLGEDNPTVKESKVVVPEAAGSAITDIAASSTDLLVNDIVGGPSRLRHFDSEGHPKGGIDTPDLSAVLDLVVTETGDFLLTVSSYTKPVEELLYAPKTERLNDTALNWQSAVDFSDIEEQRVFVVSKDGTKIPMSILMPKGTQLDGKNPTILYGYGGFGLSELPRMDIYLRSWFNRGGIYAIAHVRGGGEYGEPWHQAGMLLNKQNVIDDFAACAKFLADQKYCSPATLGVFGGSNGGITIGGLITQHPDLSRAAAIYSGVLDVLRAELEPNGEFNTTEYGSVKNREQFLAKYGYSPYHHVTDGVKYPAVLIAAGENDHRVASWHGKKMAARLQAATSSGLPVLLTVSTTAGHGFGTAFAERLKNEATLYTFFYDQLAMGASPIRKQ
jgi:prolyl oligopeptidase